ncbi:MAG TPA: M48 family metallopeptidase [Bryobacteraceae bacterium]|jgi:STE24 endopeptidase|nr:M48 family metallopeptidase [Bryobacteraceae bacterium]
MNVFAFVIFFALLTEFAVQLLASYLSLRSLLRTPAPALGKLLDEDRFRQLQRYVGARTRFSIASDVFSLSVLLLFWFNGGFRWLNNWIGSWGLGPLWTGLLLLGAIALGRAFLALPFTAYFTFGIESKFGFNKTTPQTFFADLVKGALLAVVIGGPLAAAILTLLSQPGRYFWLYAWIFATVLLVLLQIVAPRIIMPLFNKFEPLKEQQLREAISSYAASVDFPLTAISVMDASRRSSKSNAFFTGFGSNHRLVLNDTLLGRHTTPEMVAIVAHEVGHFKKKHIPLRMLLGILQLGVFFLLMSFFLNSNGLAQAFYVDHPPVALRIVFFALLYSPVAFAWSIFLNWLARRQEYEADRFSAETTRQPEAMAEALRKLTADNLSQLSPHSIDVILNYSHPPLEDRIRALSPSLREA